MRLAIIGIMLFMVLLTGCASETTYQGVVDDSGDTISEDTATAPDSEINEELEETYVEPEDIDVGELY